MHNLFKKAVSVILSVTMCITACVPAFAETYDNNGGGNSSSVSSDYTVTGTNSFGNMMASEFSAKSEEIESNQGYNVFAAEMTEPGKYLVDFEVLETSTLVVGIYEESTNKMVASENVTVTYEELNTVVEFDKSVIPQYYYIRAYLVDPATMRPRCTMYECPTYTKEMQEFLAKDVDDFDSDLVLNLDEDKDNNFAVYNSDTVFIEENGDINNVVSVDDTNSEYVIKNPDESIKKLKKGDIFAQEYDNGSGVIIVKVKSIRIENDTAYITGDEVSLEEVFQYIKIDEDSIGQDSYVEGSAGEGVTYLGADDSDTNAEQGIMTVAKEHSGSISKSHSIGFDSGDLNKNTNKPSMSGSIKFTASVSYKIYYDRKFFEKNEIYVELVNTNSLEISINITQKFEKDFKLGEFNMFNDGFIKVVLTPKVKFSAEAEMSLKGELKKVTGFCVDNNSDEGVKDLSTAPTFVPIIDVADMAKPNMDIDGKLKATLSIGITAKVLPVDLIKFSLAEATISASAGIVITITPETGIIPSADVEHYCSLCFDGKIDVEASVKFEVKLLEFLKYENTIAKATAKIADFYISDLSGFAFGECPYKGYRTTINIKDQDNVPVMAEIGTSQGIYGADENGNVDIFFKEGKQKLKLQAKGYLTIERTIDVYGPSTIELHMQRTQGNISCPAGGGNGGGGGSSWGDSGEHGGGGSSWGDTGVKQVSLGRYHSAAVTENGDLYTWGDNDYGKLGNGTWRNSSVPQKIMSNVASVSLGGRHSAAITTNGDLYIWGNNEYGQLGDGTTINSSVPKKIMSNVASVSLGVHHSAAITTNGDLYTWGYNYSGQLGDGTTTDSYVPKKIMSNVAPVSLDSSYSAAITTNGDLYTWGWNRDGMLGDGTEGFGANPNPKKIMTNVAYVNLGSWHSAAITTNGDLYTWGNNRYGSLGDGTTTWSYVPKKIMSNVASVNLGNLHSAAITTNGDLYTWGRNNYGQLGDGTTKNSYVPKKIMSDADSVSLDEHHSAAITTNGDLYTWGLNGDGQLGDGTTTDSLVPKKIDIPPQTSTVSLALDTPIMPVPDMTEPAIEPETEFIPDTEIAPEQTEPMTIAETTDPNIVTDHTEAPAPTPDVYPETNQRFTGMLKNEVYFCYGMKSRTAADPFNSDNLLFIAQAVSDGNGNLSFTYDPVENYPNAEVFVKAMTDFEVTNAEITGISESGDNISVTWNVVPNASKYAVYKVMNGVYIKAGETSGNSCVVTDIIPNYTYKLIVTSCVNGEWSVPSDENAVYFMKTVESEILLGDLNENGDLDDEDISMMKAKLAETDGTFEKIHDVNEDTYFDIRDLSALIYLVNTAL